MRAPFNTTCTLRDGPSTATPGFPRVVDAACRLVSDEYFRSVELPNHNALAYFTIDVSLPRGPQTTDLGGDTWRYEYGFADRVEFAVLAGVSWKVLRVDLCTWFKYPPYWRAEIALADEPPPTACSDAYPEQWSLFNTVTGELVILTRTGTTTWAAPGWIMIAETDGPPGTGCVSQWLVFKGAQSWFCFFNGAMPGNFSPNPPGTEPLTATPIP